MLSTGSAGAFGGAGALGGAAAAAGRGGSFAPASAVAVAGELCGGRLVAMLEGGYSLSALGRSVVQHLRVLADLN